MADEKTKDQPKAPATDPAPQAVGSALADLLRRADQQQQAELVAQARRATEIHEVEGGRYIVNGREVDADGKPLKGDKAD